MGLQFIYLKFVDHNQHVSGENNKISKKTIQVMTHKVLLVDNAPCLFVYFIFRGAEPKIELGTPYSITSDMLPLGYSATLRNKLYSEIFSNFQHLVIWGGIHHCKKLRLLRVTQGYPEYSFMWKSIIDYFVGFSLIIL